MNWKQIFITCFLSVSFLAISYSKNITISFFGLLFYLILVGAPVFFITQCGIPKEYYDGLKKYIAGISLLVSIVFYYIAFTDKFDVFVSLLYWLLSVLISFPLYFLLRPFFQKADSILNTKRPKIFWAIITAFLFLIVFVFIFILI
jgi:hypothetical protein